MRLAISDWSDSTMQPTLAAGPIQKEAIVKRMTVLLAVCTMFLATSLQAQAPQAQRSQGQRSLRRVPLGRRRADGAGKGRLLSEREGLHLP